MMNKNTSMENSDAIANQNTREYEGFEHEEEETKVLLGFSEKLLERFVFE